MRRLIPIVPLVLLLAACVGPDHGLVHDKHFSPAHTVHGTSCSRVGKTTVCSPTSDYYGDEWDLDVYASKDEHGWRSVDERTYDTCRVGMYFDRGDCR